MAGAPKPQVEHPLLKRAERIRDFLDAGRLDQADAEIRAAVEEGQTITDLASTDRAILEAVLNAYRERGKGLGAHPVLKSPEHVQLGIQVASIRNYMRALLAGQPAPTPPPAPAATTPAAGPTPATAPAPAAAGPGPPPPRPAPVVVPAPAPAPTKGPAPAAVAAPKGPGKISDALRGKAHPKAIQVIETVIDWLPLADDEAGLKAKLEEKKVHFGKDDETKANTVKNLARALKAIQDHEPPLLQDLDTVTEAERVQNRAVRIKEIFEQCYANIVLRQLLGGAKKIENKKSRERVDVVVQKDDAKALIEIVHAIKRSGKEAGIKELREKLFGSQAIGRTMEALDKDPAIREILEAGKGKGLSPHRIIQNVDKAEGAQRAANTDELYAKVQAVLGRMKEIIKRVKRENGRAPRPAAAPAAPAAGPAAAPAAAPRPHAHLDNIQNPNLKSAIEAANLSPEDLDLVVLTLELWQENANDSPLLRAFQAKVKDRVADCIRFSENKNPGDASVLKRAIELLVADAHQALQAGTLKALEQKSGEKALREALVGFYYHLPNLKADMERLLKVLAIDPKEAKEGPERKYVLDVQKEIRTILYTEIPEVINANTKGKKDPREKLDILSEMTLRERSGKSQEVVAKLREIEELIEGLPDTLKPARPTPPSRPQAPTPAPVVAPPGGPAAPVAAPPAEAAAPPIAQAPARAPKKPAGVPSLYPRAGKRIELEHVETLMERVLQKFSLYNEESPIGRAVQTLLKEYAEDINMAELEQFLRKPNIPTNAEATAFQTETEAQLRALENKAKRELQDIEAQITALNNRLSAHRGGPEESARIREEIQELREGVLDKDRNVVTLGRNQLEDRIKNIQHALQLKTGNRRYGSVREALAMIHIYLRQKGIERDALSLEDIADTMEQEIEEERDKQHAIKWYHRLRPNFLKPTLEDTLTHLARKDAIIKKMGVENMEELARAHDDGTRVEAWIEDLGDREFHYQKTVPRLIAYLEFALRDARATYLNSFSQENARNLIAHLKTARHNYVLNKLSAEVADKSDADKMIAYFKELERHTVDETKITKKFITRHSKWALVKRGAPVLGVGIALPFLGVTLAPIALGASVVGGGVSLIGKGVGKLGSVMDWKWLKDREKHFYKGAARGAVVTAVGMGLAAVMPWAWPAAILGGAAAIIPEIAHNRDILWRGTKKTAGVAGAAVAGGARVFRRRRRPPPTAAA